MILDKFFVLDILIETETQNISVEYENANILLTCVFQEAPHQCPTCGKTFNQRSNLKTHLLTHTDFKPHTCQVCKKVFRRNCDLRRHVLIHKVCRNGMTSAELASMNITQEETGHLHSDGSHDMDIVSRGVESHDPESSSSDSDITSPRKAEVTDEVEEEEDILIDVESD